LHLVLAVVPLAFQDAQLADVPAQMLGGDPFGAGRINGGGSGQGAAGGQGGQGQGGGEGQAQLAVLFHGSHLLIVVGVVVCSFVFSLRSRCPETGVLQKFFQNFFCVRLTSKGYVPARPKPGPSRKFFQAWSVVLVPVVPILVLILLVFVLIVVIVIAVIRIVRAGGVPVVLGVAPGRRGGLGLGSRRGRALGLGLGRHRGGLPVLFLLAGGVLLGHRPAQVNGDAIPVFRLQLGLEGCFLPDLPVVVLAAGRDGHGPAPGQKSLFKGFLDQFLHGVVA